VRSVVDRKRPADDEELDRPADDDDDEDESRDELETARDQSADDGDGASDDEEDEAGASREGDDAAAEAGDPDARAAAIGRSLGVVDEQQDGGEAEEPAAAPVKNRAARRRERALERRGRVRAAGEVDEDAPAEEGGATKPAKAPSVRETERDRNKRLRDELLERRRQAAKRATEAAAPAQTGLAASEVAEDVLVRTSAAALKWFRRHSALAGWLVFGAIVLTAGALYYVYRSKSASATASDALSRAALTEQAMVLAPEEDTRTDEQKADDTRQFFPSADELEQRQWDGAIEGYTAVLGSPLAPADDDVRARALEGRAFAKESKGDVDGALADFQQLEAVAGFKALGLYHRARLLYGEKKQTDEAKKLLVEARDVLEKATVEARAAGIESPSRWLSRVTEELLRTIDPAAAPPKAPSLGPDLSPEQLQRLLGQQGLGVTPGLPGRGAP
jgi:hypothetical protein